MRKKVNFLPDQLTNCYSYEAYKTFVSDLVSQGKTSGPEQREALIHYTELNAKRMKRVEKTTVLTEEVKANLLKLSQPLTWLVISEAWCGDAAQIVPVIGKIAAETEHLDLKIILRDEHLDIMDQYLTNGGRSIPKLICLDEQHREVFTWGPRPKTIQQVVIDTKSEGITDHGILVERIQNAYNQDRSTSIQQELSELMSLHFS
ncbi:MAG: thioredoxin family protein [Crocinitomicaceae bacterium]|nr:thioredoxin family protein [Crocinitomicaceae bacterium]